MKALDFSPDGRTLAAITSNGQADDLGCPVAIAALRRDSGLRGSKWASPSARDGQTLAAASSTGIGLWDAETGASIGRIPADLPYGGDLAFSADGALLAVSVGEAACRGQRSGTWPSARAWPPWRAAPKGMPRRRPQPGRRETRSRWLRQGRSPLGHAYEEADPRPRHRRRRRNSLEFSPDGRILAVSGFGEPTASLWDVATGTRIGPSLTAGRRTAMIDLSADGRKLLLTLANGEGAVWEVDPESWARRACALANRTLTREEWERFLPGRPYEPACAA